MEKKQIHVDVSWADDNYCARWEDGQDGVVLVAAKTLGQLKHDFEESLQLHIQGCVEDGDVVPEYLLAGDYEPVYDLDAAALIRNAETYTTLSAISRTSGINQKQLSHYANGLKRPRAAQLQKIKNGITTIAAQLMALI